MAELHYCDICGEVLKNEVIVIALCKHTIHDARSPYTSVEEYFRTLYNQAQRNREKVVVKEICPECNKVLGFLFNIRLTKLRKVKKEMKKFQQLFNKEDENEPK